MKTNEVSFAKNIKKLLACLGVTVACLVGISQSAYASVAGHVQFVSGNVQITNPAGQTRQVQKGDAVSEGDTLTSALSSSAQIKMQDGGFVAVRADTKLKFDEFVFAGKQDGSEKSFFSLFKGGFRAVTGLIGQINKQNYKITTPAATIGIRGTDHETFMITPDSPLALAAPTGAYSKVNVGETFMATEKGTIFVQPNQMGFAGGMNQAPQLQPLNTNIFTVAAAPTAKAKTEKKEEKKEGGESKQANGEKNGDQGEKSGDGKDSKASGDAAADDTAPVRESAVVDATPPAAGSVPATTAPVTAVGTTGLPVFVPVVALPPPVITAGGQVINLGNQTVVPVGGGAAVAITGNIPVYAALNGYGYEVVGADAAGVWFNPFNTNLLATSYLLDAANNLVEVVGEVKFAGGVAKDTYKAADGSVYFGRWQGGTVTNTFPALTTFTMGNNSSQWVFSANPPLGYVQTLAGITNYSLTAATHPTDKLGNVGTLSVATLSADFTTQIVNISLALSFSTADPINISTQNKAFTVSAASIPISLETIWGAGTVTCTGANCDASYYANIWARFAATTANKVAIPYEIWGVTDLVQGVALVTAATAPVVTTVAPAGTVAAYVQTDKAVAFAQFAGTCCTFGSTYLNETHIFIAAPADIVPLVGTGPGTVTLVDRYSGKGPGAGTRTYTMDSATVGQAAVTMGNGIQYGRYDSNTFAQQVVTGTINNGLAAGTYSTADPVNLGGLGGNAPIQLHWIIGPAINPVYLPEVLLTTNAYTLSGQTIATASSGLGASLNSATLSVNFTQQLVSFALNLMVNTIPWIASSSNAPLEFHYWNGAKSGFRADNYIGVPPLKNGGDLTLTVNGTTVLAGQTAGPVSIVKGQLTGNGLDGALLSYFLNNGSDQVTGVAAFTGTPIAAPSYRLVALSTADPAPSADQFPVGVTPFPIPVVIGGYNNASSVLMDGAGNLTQFRSTGPNDNVMFTATTVGTAVTATGLGTDPVSGISWGRWDNASFKTTEVVSGIVTTANNTGSAHWIASPALTGPVTLPLTGVFNYVKAGGTIPTDSLGGQGTLNSASLSANFTAQTVTIGINVTTPNAGNLIASAPNLPIEQKSFFNAGTAGAIGAGGIPGSMTITCGAGCVGTPQGGLGGAFAGPGGIGAAVLYGFAAGASNTVIVNGAVAFHR